MKTFPEQTEFLYDLPLTSVDAVVMYKEVFHNLLKVQYTGTRVLAFPQEKPYAPVSLGCSHH